MASTTDAKTIIDQASIALDDVGLLNWFEDELLIWLNLSQVEMVNLAPRTNIKNVSMQLVAGIKQTLPDDGIVLLDVPYNRGLGNTGAGSAINATPRTFMNSRIPNWTIETAYHIVKRYMYNPEDPTTFYVYPPQPVSPAYVEIVYAATPAVIANSTAGTKITVGDQYRNILLNLTIAKALTKLGEKSTDPLVITKALEYRALAEMELGLRGQSQQGAEQQSADQQGQ
jgi:hypothetical protein